MTQVNYSTPNAFQLSTDEGVFLLCVKVKSCEEGNETLSVAFTGYSTKMYVVEKCKNRPIKEGMRIKHIL